jgi:hypothetical protein
MAHKILLGLESASRIEPADLPHEIEKIRCFILLLFHGCLLGQMIGYL